MRQFKDLTGMTFNRLTVIRRHCERDKNNKILWVCKCSCGNDKEIIVIGTNLTSGETKSCGCLMKEHNKKRGELQIEDLTGQKFGRLTVIELAGKIGCKISWLCECSCEARTRKIVKANHLKTGYTKSCGCLHKEHITKIGKNNTKHNLRYSRIYTIHKGMIQRCYNTNDCNKDTYKYYGGKGVKVCDEWLIKENSQGFLNFYNWAMDNGYTDNLSIDRIDVNGNYEPSNCRWTSMKEQVNNKTNNVIIEYKGKTQSLSKWCDELQLSYHLVHERIKNGWNIEDAFTRKVTQKKNITYKGETKCLAEWCKELDLNYGAIQYRINKIGMTFEEAINKPCAKWKER